MEVPFPNAPPIQRDCFCSNHSLPMDIKSTSNVVEVHFTILSMDALDDYNNLYFEGLWDFEKSIQCQQKRILKGSFGEIKYQPPTDEDEVRRMVYAMSSYNKTLKTLFQNNWKRQLVEANFEFFPSY